MTKDFQGLASRVGGKMDAEGGRCTVQFLVEKRHDGIVLPGLPLPIWVYFPAEKNVSYGCDVCEVVYRVVEESINATYSSLGLRRPDNLLTPCVCDHMGHLIE